MERESDREKAGQRWGEKAEPKSVAPEQRRAEAKSRERRQIWNLGLSTRQRAGAVGTGDHDQRGAGSLGGEGMSQDLRGHGEGGQEFRGQG